MTMQKNHQELLLLKDVDNLGRKGDLVKKPKAGFVRNFLLPQGYAVIADKRTIRMKERLQEERKQQAAVDRKDSEAIAAKLKDKTFEHTVKVDPQGHLYGSVTTQDIVNILAENGVSIERKMLLIGQPIRKLGIHQIPLRLREDVDARVALRVQDEKGRIEIIVEDKPEPKKEEFAQEQEAAAKIEEEIAQEDESQGES